MTEVLPVQDPPAASPRPAGSGPTSRRSSTHLEPGAREARLSRFFADFVDSGSSVTAFIVRHPRAALGVVLDIRSLPRLHADLPPGQEAEAVRQQLMRHRTSRRFMSGVSAVLEIPNRPEAYLEGHERATVRRKVRTAVKKGVSVRPVGPEERRALLEVADQHEQHNERVEYRIEAPQNGDLLQYGMWFAAYDPEDHPIALAVTPIAGEWATLRYFRTLQTGDASSDARYLMTKAVAEELSGRGVRYLVDTARPHWLPNGLRHFQRMVGFRLARVSPARITR